MPPGAPPQAPSCPGTCWAWRTRAVPPMPGSARRRGSPRGAGTGGGATGRRRAPSPPQNLWLTRTEEVAPVAWRRSTGRRRRLS
ncbi:hypothetical protein SORBI_3006G180500 [Sorghum bicolor]|uniref:Uncharacterized protein n=1 Tax=Sorghum bicolor TaxID=4558 RepID=A0A1B6PML4_SORBI|nr:hypothetical protein SORBI_3006G180500 [Sorghum bicolor]